MIASAELCGFVPERLARLNKIADTLPRSYPMTYRILLVSDHFPPFLGGAHRQSYLLAQQLARRGHEVTVVTAWQPGVPAQEIDGQVTVYRLKELRTLLPALVRDRQQRHHPPYPDPVVAWQLRRLINQLQPDVVHSHGWFGYSCAAAL